MGYQLNGGLVRGPDERASLLTRIVARRRVLPGKSNTRGLLPGDLC